VVVSDKVSWSDTPTFHNTLVVGSSPTSSTTQSRETGEIQIRLQPTSRQPWEAVKEMASMARDENETLKAQLAKLEERLAGGEPGVPPSGEPTK